jgi:hypothetical protein
MMMMGELAVSGLADRATAPATGYGVFLPFF